MGTGPYLTLERNLLAQQAKPRGQRFRPHILVAPHGCARIQTRAMHFNGFDAPYTTYMHTSEAWIRQLAHLVCVQMRGCACLDARGITRRNIESNGRPCWGTY